MWSNSGQHNPNRFFCCCFVLHKGKPLSLNSSRATGSGSHHRASIKPPICMKLNRTQAWTEKINTRFDLRGRLRLLMESQFLIRSTERGHVAPQVSAELQQLFNSCFKYPPRPPPHPPPPTPSFSLKLNPDQISFHKTAPSFSKTKTFYTSVTQVEIASDTE